MMTSQGQEDPIFSVIIVNFNAGERLVRCLGELSRQIETRFEVIIADNASKDNSVQLAQATDVKFRLMALGQNTGFAVANNLAAVEAKAPWLVFLNPDAYPEATWLAEIKNAIDRHPSVDAFGSTQIDASDENRLDGAGDVYHGFGIPYRGHFGHPLSSLPTEGECFAPCAAAAVYRRSVFEEIGGFAEEFFCYGEDVDLGFRLRLIGGRSIQLPAARVHHEGSGISGRRSDFTMYHGHRNRIWTYFRNMPILLLVLMFPFHLVANFYLLLRFIVSGEVKPYLRALKDGFGGLGPVLRQRRDIQQRRKISTMDVARALTWSPFKVFNRKADIRRR